MSQEKEKPKSPVNCLEKINQDTIDDLIRLHNRDKETYGFIKDNEILGLRKGQRHSVRIEIAPVGAECEFHSHPDEIPNKLEFKDLGEDMEKEWKCAVEAMYTRISMLSPADVNIQAQLRPSLNLTSLLITEEPDEEDEDETHNLLTEYVLADREAFEEFKQEVKEIRGDVKEEDINEVLWTKFAKIFNEQQNEIYDEQQNFSACGDVEIWGVVKDNWYAFLREKGLQIKEKEVTYSKKKKKGKK